MPNFRNRIFEEMSKLQFIYIMLASNNCMYVSSNDDVLIQSRLDDIFRIILSR